VNRIDGPTKLVRQDAILGGLSIGQLQGTTRPDEVLCQVSLITEKVGRPVRLETTTPDRYELGALSTMLN